MKRCTASLKEKARLLEKELYTLYLAFKHPETPWYAKMIILLITSYAFSPLDLIPDFIPILGQIDDTLIIPMGISFALKLIPKNVLDECSDRVKAMQITGKSRCIGILIVLLMWLAMICLFLKIIVDLLL